MQRIGQVFVRFHWVLKVLFESVNSVELELRLTVANLRSSSEELVRVSHVLTHALAVQREDAHPMVAQHAPVLLRQLEQLARLHLVFSLLALPHEDLSQCVACSGRPPFSRAQLKVLLNFFEVGAFFEPDVSVSLILNGRQVLLL